MLSLKRSLFGVVLVALLCLLAHAQEARWCNYEVKEKPNAKQTGKVDPKQIEVSLTADKSTIMLGEPVYLSFTVMNHSDQDLQIMVGGDYRNALGRPESFCVVARTEEGEKVAQPDPGALGGGFITQQKIPANGSYIFKLSLGDWATFEKIGKYSITASRVMGLSRFGEDLLRAPSQASFTVQATTKLEVIPSDDKRIAEIIGNLGTALLEQRSVEPNGPSKSLAYIVDERTIPYLVQALRTHEYSMKLFALRALHKFNNDVALAALKEGIETKGADIDGAAPAELKDQLAANIRDAAAYSLSQSKHPEAIPFLLTKRADKSVGVRITVLHVLGKMRPEEALPILQEMSRDEDVRVRDEARRYIQLLEAKTIQQEHLNKL